MLLTNVSALAFLTLAVPIVIFYILKIRLRRVPISTVMFWEQIFEEKQPRSIWQQLRHLLSLLLQLAFLILLVLALSRPYFWGDAADVRRIVLIIDNSASMQATDVQPTRLQAAIDKAKSVIAGLRSKDEMAIVTAGNQAKVICGLTSHQRTLRETLDNLPGGQGTTQVAPALALARRLLADHENGRAVVLSDGRFKTAETELQGDKVSWIPIGTKADNVAITQFQVRRSLIDPLGFEVLVEVKNHSAEKVECRLDIELNNQPNDVIPLQLAPGKPWTRVLQKTSAEGGELVATLVHEDDLAADNTARAILPKRERQQVLLVTPGNVFLQRVFQACPLVDLSVAAKPPATMPDDTIVVFHSVVPQALTGKQILVIQPANATDLWDVGQVLKNPVVGKFDKDAQLMQFVHFENVLMPEARQLKLKAKANVLARTPDDAPLLATFQPDDRKIAVLTVNLDKGDLPLRTAFPIFVSNALAWFAGTKGELREAVATSRLAEITLPDKLLKSTTEDGELVLKSPSGSETLLPTGREKVTIGPLAECGVWRIVKKVEDDESESKVVDEQVPGVQIACNLANSQESDIRITDNAASHQSTLGVGVGGRPVWFYLLILGVALTATEWFLYQRRWIS